MISPIPRSIRDQNDRRPFFDNTQVDVSRPVYVAWLDVMGTSSTMLRSMKIAATSVMKLHVSVLQAKMSGSFQDLDLFPVADGVYATTERQSDLLDFLRYVFYELALTFMCEKDPLNSFLVRCAVAYGPVAKGKEMYRTSIPLGADRAYADTILFGVPCTQAHEESKNASPLGVYIHESARVFFPSDGSGPLTQTSWKWWLNYDLVDSEFLDFLCQRLEEHYKWCDGHRTSILYAEADIKRHIELWKEYFWLEKT